MIMADIISDTDRLYADNTTVKLSDEELEEYGWLYERLCQDSGRPLVLHGRRPLTFELFCKLSAMKDIMVRRARIRDERIWHIERELELRRCS